MNRNLLRRVRYILPDRFRRSSWTIAIASLLASLLEAAVLVSVVGASISISSSSADPDGPTLLGREVSVSEALTFAAAAAVVVLLLHLLIARSVANLFAGVLHELRTRAILAHGAASWTAQGHTREGALQETVTSLANQCANLVVSVATFMSAAIGLISLLSAALIIDPLATCIVIVFGVAVLSVLRPLTIVTRRRAATFVTANSEFAESVSQTTSIAMDLKVSGVLDTVSQLLIVRSAETSDRLRRTRFASRAGSTLLRDVAVVLLITALAILNSAADIDIATVGTVVLLVLRSLSYAQAANTAQQQAGEQQPNLDGYLARVQNLEAACDRFGNAAIQSISSVELQNVSYSYGSTRGVHGVSVKIAQGESIGIIGPSGSGKSTLAQLLLRLRLPDEGHIFVSGVAHREIAPAQWHRLVASVPQGPQLFEASIADNIRFFRPGISDAAVEQAADDASILAEIRSLPDGFATMLGARGAGLSGGQVQRIAIARALVGRPELLILDEPTSALDARSEHLLGTTMQSLQGRVTLIVIAHRVATLESCSRVLALEAGRVCVIGTLAEALDHVPFDDVSKPG